MKKNIPYVIIGAVIILGIGGYYSYQSRQKALNNDKNINTSAMQGMNHGSMAGMTSSANSMGYKLQLTSSSDKIKPNQPIKVSYKIVNDKGEVLKDYTVTHEKIMHFIVVRKDLQYFQHLHPEFNQSTGEFSVSVNFPTDGPYRIFPDFTPTPENPQKLTVTVNQDLNVGDLSKYVPQSVVADKEITKQVDGYNVNYTFPDQLKANTELNYTLIVEKPNDVVKLEPYLGAMGHGVILREGNLDFIHTHASGMSAMDGMQKMDHEMGGGVIDFSANFPEPGVYRIFTQFQVKGKVMTSDYAVDVK